MKSELHIGENAELYAAGLLDADEQAMVDEHAAHCRDCLRRLGEAEETVLALERVNVARSAPPPSRNVLPFARRRVPVWWLAAAAAAAFILGLVLPRGAPQPELATLAMIRSHFSHAQFSGTGPSAKVLYARDRSWYYVIVAGSHRYEVYGVSNVRRTDLGATQPRGDTSALFTRASASFDRLELRNGAALVEAAAIH